MSADSREKELFNAALDRPPEIRDAFLRDACRGDAELCQNVQELLRAFDGSSRIIADQVDTVPPDSPLNESAGTMVGRYQIIQKIGEGGMGVVYLAEQIEPIRRQVALKIIKLGMDTRQVIARFEAERQALAQMDHPSIAKVFDAGTTDSGRPFFVMELVRGVPITEYCDQGKLSTTDRLRLFVLVCQAIQHAHQKGVIHRDIKPSNAMVTLNDGRPFPRVIDFGVAKATNQRVTEKTVFTEQAQMIGTPAYMSPEQAEMSRLDVDTRTDVYSLGVLLYELLTGTTPFPVNDLVCGGYVAMQRIIAEREPLKPSTRLGAMTAEERTAVATNRSMDPLSLGRLVRGDLDWIVMKCLEKDRTRRYDTASGLAADVLRHLKDEPITASPPSSTYRFQKMVRRNKLVFAAAGAVMTALVMGLGVSLRSLSREREARKIAVVAQEAQALLRKEAEMSRQSEARLRQLAEAREKLVKAQLLCDQLKFEEAKVLMSEIPVPVLRAEAKDAANAFSVLTDFLARHGRWDEAKVFAVRAVECDPTDLNYSALAPLLVITGDSEQYQICCHDILVRFQNEQAPFPAERMAKACLILPLSGADLASVSKLAEIGVTAGASNKFLPYFEFAKGLAEYRHGRFASASDWMRKSIQNPFFGDGHCRFVQSYMVLAMALCQQNKLGEARLALTEGIELSHAKLPKLDDGDLGSGWHWKDWIITQSLIDEAESLIDGKSSLISGSHRSYP